MTPRTLTLALSFSALAAATGCDPVVGARCAPGLDPCGNLCCAEGYFCSEATTCEPRPSDRLDAGLLGPWPRPQDAGSEVERDGGTPWRPDIGPWPDASVDADVDASAPDAELDATFPDAEPDAGPGDAETWDGDYDSGVKDGEVDVDGGYPDAEADAGSPDATEPDAAFPDAEADASSPDAAEPDAAFPDAEADAGSPDAAEPDAGFDPDASVLDGTVLVDAGPICPLGTQLCDGDCFNTQTSTTHCGLCNVPCGAFEACNAGVCAPTCTSPRTQCPGGCVHVQTDANNCGTCGNVCASGVCYQGACVAPAAGHVVVIGHDMQRTHPASLAIAGNSIFLPVASHVRVGTFREATSVASEIALSWVIGVAATQQSRTYTEEIFMAAEVTQRLANVDVFVIFPQENTTDFQLITWGTDWSLALQAFVRRGGTVVLFDAGGTHAGAWQILSAAGLFSASGRTPLAVNEDLDVVAPADAIARGAPLSYPSMLSTTTFTSTLTDVVVETRSLPARPVVFHRVILP